MSRDFWQHRFTTTPPKRARYDGWLDRYLPQLRAKHPNPTVLDIGCGSGAEDIILFKKEYQVVYTDFIVERVHFVNTQICRKQGVVADHSFNLPFKPATFHAVIGSLSLHYFTDTATVAIFHEIKRVLKKDGIFLARFNSITDKHYGADKRDKNSDTATVNGVFKRFYTVQHLRCLTENVFTNVSLRKNTTTCYGPTKNVIEVSAKI